MIMFFVLALDILYSILHHSILTTVLQKKNIYGSYDKTSFYDVPMSNELFYTFKKHKDIFNYLPTSAIACSPKGTVSNRICDESTTKDEMTSVLCKRKFPTR